jgi:hypothetical protein
MDVYHLSRAARPATLHNSAMLDPSHIYRISYDLIRILSVSVFSLHLLILINEEHFLSSGRAFLF